MKQYHYVILVSFLGYLGYAQAPGPGQSSFDKHNDLLLAQYDCKTDVDDLHSVAAFATLLANAEFAGLNYHAVAGAYGIQEGLYVPPNELFQQAFGDSWSDAHTDFRQAVTEVTALALATLDSGGDVWIAEGGQSDFSAVVVSGIRQERPGLDTKGRIHLIQHSTWNEEVTSPEKLEYVKAFTDYQKIPDGNATGNGTPGFRSETYKSWAAEISDARLLKIWETAVRLGNLYNGKEGRYMNEAVAAGGLDFSDTCEVAWILGLDTLEDSSDFFETYGQ